MFNQWYSAQNGETHYQNNFLENSCVQIKECSLYQFIQRSLSFCCTETWNKIYLKWTSFITLIATKIHLIFYCYQGFFVFIATIHRFYHNCSWDQMLSILPSSIHHVHWLTSITPFCLSSISNLQLQIPWSLIQLTPPHFQTGTIILEAYFAHLYPWILFKWSPHLSNNHVAAVDGLFSTLRWHTSIRHLTLSLCAMPGILFPSLELILVSSYVIFQCMYSMLDLIHASGEPLGAFLINIFISWKMIKHILWTTLSDLWINPRKNCQHFLLQIFLNGLYIITSWTKPHDN